MYASLQKRLILKDVKQLKTWRHHDVKKCPFLNSVFLKETTLPSTHHLGDLFSLHVE